MLANDFAKAVHENSVLHGWWEEPRSDEWCIALIHSELSEALEEYRAGRPNAWYACEEVGNKLTICNPRDETECFNYGREQACSHRGHKPEGIAVELIDAVIRIFDLFGYHGWKIAEDDVQLSALHEQELCSAIFEQSFPEFICSMHCGLSAAAGATNPEKRRQYLMFTANAILMWVQMQDDKEGNAEKLLLEKHEYNRTRPYKHGKVC